VPAVRSYSAGGKQAGCRIGVRLKPASSREKIVSVGAEEVCLAVTAAPVEGKANEAMIRLLARELDTPKSSIRILRGATSRSKLVEIAAMTKENVVEKLKAKIEYNK
jgi:uncharacterized protein